MSAFSLAFHFCWPPCTWDIGYLAKRFAAFIWSPHQSHNSHRRYFSSSCQRIDTVCTENIFLFICYKQIWGAIFSQCCSSTFCLCLCAYIFISHKFLLVQLHVFVHKTQNAKEYSEHNDCSSQVFHAQVANSKRSTFVVVVVVVVSELSPHHPRVVAETKANNFWHVAVH